MAVFHRRPTYARLRRLPNDSRLFVTENGATRSGQLIGVGLRYRHDAFPYLTLDLDNTGPFEPDVMPEFLELCAPELFTADVDALAPYAEHDFAYAELQRCCGSLRDVMHTAAPECQHEDVIETPELGRVDTPGICVWCPTPLVRVEGEWQPA